MFNYFIQWCVQKTGYISKLDTFGGAYHLVGLFIYLLCWFSNCISSIFSVNDSFLKLCRRNTGKLYKVSVKSALLGVPAHICYFCYSLAIFDKGDRFLDSLAVQICVKGKPRFFFEQRTKNDSWHSRQFNNIRKSNIVDAMCICIWNAILDEYVILNGFSILIKMNI